MPTYSKNQQGLSIIEMMIALVLGLILLAGVIQIFISNRATSRVQEAVARVQENGRVVMEYLAREIRAADYWGCAPGIDTFTNHLDTANADYDPVIHDFSGSQGITGTDNDGVNNSDSITLSGLFGEELPLTTDMSGSFSADITVPANNDVIAAGDILFISNCKGGDIFQVSAGDPGVSGTIEHSGPGGSFTPGNNTTTCITSGANACENCFCQSYGEEASVHAGYNSSRYYIDNGTDGPTLFVDDIYNPPVALATGIENMQIAYGEDTDGDGSANRYLEAGNVNLNMDNVVSVKVNLLVASTEAVTSEQQSTRFNWEEILANDSSADPETIATDLRLRRTYTMTVSIRNRIN